MTLMQRVFTATGLVVLSASGLQGQQQRDAASPPLPATCVAGLRSYGTLEEVPRPWERLPMPQRAVDESVNAAFARIGATGITMEKVPEAELTPRERALMAENGIDEAFRSVPLFVASDSARVYEACRRTRPT